MTKVLSVIAQKQPSVTFAQANADVCPGLASQYGADEVPFVVFCGSKGQKIDTLAGADPPKLVEKVSFLASRPASELTAAVVATPKDDITEKLKELTAASDVMLFMKGSKVEPFCKFSKEAVALLNKYSAEYSTFDILEDKEVREQLKEYSQWKTYPQLYIKGKLIGGIDIMKEYDEDGELEEMLPKAEAKLEDRLKELLNKEPVMLFMKGCPDEPRCGFSGKIVGILNEHSVKFGTFDILSDEEVRQGLKTYSNWPTYPQLYSRGKLIGGIDIVRELAEEGSLLEELSGTGM
eukprot:CAMPEP_0194482166 /NCGR_PEP_ID=MMETSP0253-20130528/4244_1 /TAXON_ID=2966 /ORGANISM="Noctiluca scintillans" /LENGTH=292 /DNA_ID=CAMNT_0039321689 /DNA_START=80 /DNA_END=958 /DNA_ORIENTATION=-